MRLPQAVVSSQPANTTDFIDDGALTCHSSSLNIYKQVETTITSFTALDCRRRCDFQSNPITLVYQRIDDVSNALQCTNYQYLQNKNVLAGV